MHTSRHTIEEGQVEKGVISEVKMGITNGSLRATVLVEGDDGSSIEAGLPQREIAALLPRSVFLGAGDSLTAPLLSDLQSTIEKLLIRRPVELWEYKERMYCGFEKWRNIGPRSGNTTAPDYEPEKTEASCGEGE